MGASTGCCPMSLFGIKITHYKRNYFIEVMFTLSMCENDI